MESMEGRLMLASAVTEFLPSGLTPVHFFADSDTPAFTANRSTLVPSFHEGGFISAPLSPIANPIDLDAVGDITTPQLLPSNPLTQDSAEPPTSVAAPESITGDDTVFTTEVDSNLNGLLFGLSGIQPAIIPVSEGMRRRLEFVGPILSSSNSDETIRDEGGPISIAAVLTNIRPLDTLEPHEPAPTQLVAAPEDESPTATPLAEFERSADREISGELARALIFEIAGGEPTASARTPDADRTDPSADPPGGATQEIYRPVSYQDQPSQAQGSMPERVGRTAPVRTATFAQYGGGSEFHTGLYYSRGDEAGSSLPTRVLLAERRISGAAVPAINAPHVAAHARVFERLGQQVEVPSEPLAIQLSWRGALNATPLLMILALERIAASNSRRASRHEGFASSYKSLRRGRTFERLREGS
jgi:hypothetical protein